MKFERKFLFLAFILIVIALIVVKVYYKEEKSLVGRNTRESRVILPAIAPSLGNPSSMDVEIRNAAVIAYRLRNLHGHWFLPHDATNKLDLSTDGTFRLDAYNILSHKGELLTGTFFVSGDKLILKIADQSDREFSMSSLAGIIYLNSENYGQAFVGPFE